MTSPLPTSNTFSNIFEVVQHAQLLGLLPRARTMQIRNVAFDDLNDVRDVKFVLHGATERNVSMLDGLVMLKA